MPPSKKSSNVVLPIWMDTVNYDYIYIYIYIMFDDDFVSSSN